LVVQIFEVSDFNFFYLCGMNKEILRLAIPNIISNISVPLLSSVDTALMGHLSTQHLAAVGLSAMIFNFIYWNFGFLRMGTTGMTAQAYGKEDQAAMIHSFGRAFILALIISTLIMLLQYPLFNFFQWSFNISANQEEYVGQYFFIRIMDAPATLTLVVLMGWFFGMQNVIYPLMLTILINIINIGTSYYFVYHLNWGIAGVAYGTLIAQYIGLGFALLLFAYKYRYLWVYFKRRALMEVEAFSQFLNVNRDIFIRTLSLSLCFAFFYSQSSKISELTLAANTVLLQFLNWMSYGVDGFAFAAESLVGKYKGANKKKETLKAIRLSFIWGMGLALGYSLIYAFAGSQLLLLFSDQQEVLSLANQYLFWIIILPILGTPSYIWDGIFVGLTASRAMRNSMLIAALFYFLSYYLAIGPLGNHGLWLALIAFLLMRALVQSWQIWRKGWELN
jgi:MATE family multidrug resistance protein